MRHSGLGVVVVKLPLVECNPLQVPLDRRVTLYLRTKGISKAAVRRGSLGVVVARLLLLVAIAWFAVGFEVGFAVGWAVGFAVGLAVGFDVGFRVGGGERR